MTRWPAHGAEPTSLVERQVTAPALDVGRFWQTFVDVLLRPRRGIDAIAAAPRPGEGWAAAALFGGLYALASLLSAANGRVPAGQTLTFIPSERYYLWQSFYCLPMTVGWMGLFSAISRALATRLGGRGSFGADLTALAFTFSAPMIILFWLPDVGCYLLRVPEAVYLKLVPVYGLPAMTWALVLSTAGIAATEHIPWRRALPVVLAAEAASAVLSGVALAMR